MNDAEKRFFRSILYELVTECRSIEDIKSARERLLKFSVFLRKVIRDYFAEHEHDWKDLIPFLNLQKSFLGESANAVYRAERFCKKVAEGKKVPDAKIRQAANDFRRAVRKHLDQIGEWCDVKIDFDTMSLIGKSASQPPNAGVAPELEPRSTPHVTPSPASARSFKSEPVFETPRDSRPVSGPANRVERPQRLDLDAREGDRYLTASTVAEYAFCPRAGVLTHESGFSERDEELPSLGPLPWFERDAIEERLYHCKKNMFMLMVGFAAAIFVLTMLPIGKIPLYGLILCCVGGVSLLITPQYLDWLELARRQLAMKLASPCRPNPESDAMQPVNWWGLLLAGFEVTCPDRATPDDRWRLSGKPHRIITLGDETIPVHRTKSSDGILQPQHIVRAMIHCHLMLMHSGTPCAYAIVLFGDTYEGVTVPNTLENRERFYSVLKRARAMIIETDAGDRDPPAPTDASTRCYGCFHGQPRPASNEDKTTKHGQTVDPFFFRNRKGTVFHCSCGDRFREMPMHRKNRGMKKI